MPYDSVCSKSKRCTLCYLKNASSETLIFQVLWGSRREKWHQLFLGSRVCSCVILGLVEKSWDLCLRMSYNNIRTLTGTCERCHSTLQSVAELLILSCDARPIRTDTISSKSTFVQVSERIIASAKTIKTLMKSVINYVHMITTKSVEICEGLTELTSTVVTFMELCSHVSYICAISFKDCCQAIPGLVDRYSISLAGLEIKLSCNRLKKTRVDDLSPQLIIDLCSNISKHISVLTNICKSADEKVRDEGTRDQFKLCVKSVTCAAGCLIASIKTYKSHPSTRYHARFINFCDPVSTTAQALVTFATEEDFVGKEAVLSPEARDVQKSILGKHQTIRSRGSGLSIICGFWKAPGTCLNPKKVQ